MTRKYFRQLETSPQGTSFNAKELLEQLSWNDQGLIPVITQEYRSKQVLMHAWMNPKSLAVTLESMWMTYWSRSRQQLWKKGETSGNRQRLLEMRIDCDGDTLLCLVEQNGPACHTGRDHCFYFELSAGSNQFVVTQSKPDAGIQT